MEVTLVTPLWGAINVDAASDLGSTSNTEHTHTHNVIQLAGKEIKIVATRAVVYYQEPVPRNSSPVVTTWSQDIITFAMSWVDM